MDDKRKKVLKVRSLDMNTNEGFFDSNIGIKTPRMIIPIMEFFDEGFYPQGADGCIYLIDKDHYVISYNRKEDKLHFEPYDEIDKKSIDISKYRLSSYALTYERIQLLIRSLIADYYSESLENPDHLSIPMLDNWRMFVNLVSLKMGELDYKLKDIEYPISGGWY